MVELVVTISHFKFPVSAMFTLGNVARKWFQLNLTLGLCPLNLTSDLWPFFGVCKTKLSDKFEEKSVLKQKRNLYSWPSVTWPLSSVAMATTYFGRTCHPNHTCKVSVPARLPLEIIAKTKVLHNLIIDLWPLTCNLWPSGVSKTYFPTFGYLPTKFEEIRSSRFVAVFKVRKCTCDLLSHNLWPWLPWQQFIFLAVDTFIMCVKFPAMVPFGAIPKN